MQPIMLTIFLAIMSLTSWSLFQQMNQRAQVEAAEAVAHTVRELAQTQRIWHTQHGEGVPWQNRYLTHVPDNCPPYTVRPGYCTGGAGQWLQLGAPLWYCEVTHDSDRASHAGDRLPIFTPGTWVPTCNTSINQTNLASRTRLTDRHGNPRGTSTTVAEANYQGQAVPWWNGGHPDAEKYATWATRSEPETLTGPARLADDHSFQVIYRAGPDDAAAPARDWQDARAHAQRVANALGALACIGRREGSSAATTWYDCDEGAEIGRRRGPGSGSTDRDPYYVIARYERPLARTMVDSMLPRDGKRHAWGDFRFSTGKSLPPLSLTGRPGEVDEEIRLMHDSGSLAMRYGARLIVGCGGDATDCPNKRHVDLDARALGSSTQMRGAPPLPGLYMRTLRDPHSNDVPITLVASPNGPRATFGRIRMSVNGAATGVVEGVQELRPPSRFGVPWGAVKLKMVGTGEKRMVVCSNEHVSKCAEYHL